MARKVTLDWKIIQGGTYRNNKFWITNEYTIACTYCKDDFFQLFN